MSLTMPPGAGLFFGQAQWKWIVSTLQSIYREQQTQAAAIASVQQTLEHIMTQSDDLTGAVAANTEAVHAITQAIGPLTDAITSEIADVQELLALLAAGPQSSPAVADAITAVKASTAELETATQNLVTETSDLKADDSSVPHP